MSWSLRWRGTGGPGNGGAGNGGTGNGGAGSPPPGDRDANSHGSDAGGFSLTEAGRAVAATRTEVAVQTRTSRATLETASLSESDLARLKGYTGDACDECGCFTMVRNGACLKCVNCGATSGCS